MTSNTSELFEFNKMVFIYILTVSIVFVWILKMILHRSIILKKTFLDIPVLLFLIVIGCSTFFSIDVHTSLFGYYGRFNGGVFSLLSYILLFYAFVSNISFQDLHKLLKVSIVSSVVVLLWGLPGRFGHDLSCFLFMGQWNNSCWTNQFHPEVRMFSTLGQPNWLGAYLAIHLCFGMFFLMKSSRPQSSDSNIKQKGYVNKKITASSIQWNTVLWYFYVLAVFIGILWTRSRSSLIAALIAIGGIVFLWFVSIYKQNTLHFLVKKSILWLCIVMIPLFIFKTGISSIDAIIDLPKKLFVTQQSSQTEIQQQKPDENIIITESFDIRKIVWEGALLLGKKFPLFGTGPETFAYSYYFVRPATHNYVSEWDYLYNKAHNEFLNYLSTTGFAGLVSYGIMIGFVFFALIKLFFSFLYRSLKPSPQNNAQMETYLLSISLFFALISIHFTNFFGFATTTINLFLFLIPAFFILQFEQSEKEKQLTTTDLNNAQLFGITFSVIAYILILIGCFRYWFADTLYASADIYVKQGDYQSAAKILQSAIEINPDHVYMDKYSYILANVAALIAYQKKDTLPVQFINESIKYNDLSLKESSKNVLYWKTKAKNTYLFYQVSLNSQYLKNGIDALNKAFEFAPSDPKIPYSKSVFYSLLFDDEKNSREKNLFQKLSLDSIEESIRLKNNYRDSYFLKGQLLKKYQNKKEAKQAFQYILEHINKEDSEAIKEMNEI